MKGWKWLVFFASPSDKSELKPKPIQRKQKHWFIPK